MLEIRYPVEKRMFYAIGFTVFESCCIDFDVTNPFLLFIKEVGGDNPVMGHLMEKLLEQHYIVRN